MLWSHDVRCGVMCSNVVRSGVMWWCVVSCGVVYCGVVSCDRICLSGWLNGVLVAWQLGLFGSLGYWLGVWLMPKGLKGLPQAQLSVPARAGLSRARRGQPKVWVWRTRR